ncbi:MAG: adenylosuccinate lyase [Calditrichaeota bacterium]|nr:MAG: adenylosuccinate lyase [Calditrichota bacterium]
MIERYTLKEMGAIWSDQMKYQTWLDVEIAAARAMAEAKMIPMKSVKVIEKKAKFEVARINEIEAEINHDVIAFLTAVTEHVGEDAKYLHYGMTSSDMLDTALSLQMKKAAAIIDKKIVLALKEIKKLAEEYKMSPCIGRSHGVFAEPTTVGLKFAMWYTELQRAHVRFTAAAKTISTGMISGAVGNFANVDPKIERSVCKQLGLKPAEVSTQVIQRDRHAEFITSLALLGSSLEKFATEVRHLQRTEVGEMMEGFSKKQKGSSAMPHKKNPITAERITGIARLLRGYAVSAMENIALWHERDIAHSSVERIIIPDSCIIIDYGLQKFIELLKGLVVNEKRMLENIYFEGGVVFSQRLLLKLTPILGDRDKAYRLVQKNAMAAHDGKGLFKKLVKQDNEINQHLSDNEIDECFDLSYYTKNVGKIFRRVFKK